MDIQQSFIAVCVACKKYGIAKKLLSIASPEAKTIVSHLKIIADWLEERFGDYKDANVRVEFARGVGVFPRVPWICILPPGQKTSDGVFVSICFGRDGNGAVVGFAQSMTNPRGLETTIRKTKEKEPNINVDGTRPGTRYNNSFVNPLEILRNSFDEEKLVDHIRQSLDLALRYLGEDSLSGLNQEVKQIASETLTDFIEAANDANLVFEPTLCWRLIASLLSKRFVLLTGLSGSGKTRIAQSIARWLSSPTTNGDVNSALIPVGADWTSNENIIGYPNGLDAGAYVLTPCLSLLLRALDPATAWVPHFLILDEMNLSHVERYFADFLSALESGETIPLYEGPERRAGDMVIPQSLRLPPNLFVIGTVNVDETTYMFSPKVLDRANVLEFRMAADDLGAFLASPGAPDLGALAGQGAEYAEAFVRAASREDTQVPVSVRKQFASEMLLFFNLLQRHNVAFGYRVAHEAGRFLHFHALLGGNGDGDVDWFNSAMDAVIVQKLLPKLHGSRSRLEGLLWALAWACGASREDRDGQGFEAQLRLAGQATNEGVYGPERLWETLARDHPDSPWLGARYPLSFEKVMRMWRALVRDQFVSYSEA